MKLRSLCEKFSAFQHQNAEQIQPSILGSAVRFPYGPFEFKTRVAKGFSCDVEASTNLKNWSQIGNCTGSDEIDFVDSSARQFSHRFYRLNVNGVYSMNVIGYATVALPPGFSMVANPFQAADNRVAELFKGVPEGAIISKYDPQLSRLTQNNFRKGEWTNRIEKMVPGEGALFFNPAADYINVNFVGTVMQGNFSTPIPAGFSIRSSVIPQFGNLDTDLGFPATEGDVIHLFDRDKQKYVLYPYDPETWSSNPPIVSLGESFWVAKKTAKNWIRSFQPENDRLGFSRNDNMRPPINVHPLPTMG